VFNPGTMATAVPQVLRPAQYAPCWRDYTRSSIILTSSLLLSISQMRFHGFSGSRAQGWKMPIMVFPRARAEIDSSARAGGWALQETRKNI